MCVCVFNLTERQWAGGLHLHSLQRVNHVNAAFWVHPCQTLLYNVSVLHLKSCVPFFFMLQVPISGNGQIRAAHHHERKGREVTSGIQPEFHRLHRWSWRWAGSPATIIQACVVLQTQTLNVIRCWLDNDTVRLIFCTYQVTVFTINIMSEIRTRCSVGRVSQRELDCAYPCVCVHACISPTYYQAACTHTYTQL